MKHKLPVKAVLQQTITLTFQFNPDTISLELPSGCFLETKNDKAFLILAFVKTKNMRPAFLPDFLGRSFYLIGIRVIVNWYDKEKRLKRGLYVLKSYTDSRILSLVGNWMTGYHFEYLPIKFRQMSEKAVLSAQDFKFEVDLSSNANVKLPNDSHFENWNEARKYAGPMRYTCVRMKEPAQMMIVEGMKERWIPRPIQVNSSNYSLLTKLFGELKLCAAFEIKDIPYYWKKGVVIQVE